MAYLLNTNLVQPVQIIMPDASSQPVQISGSVPLPTGAGSGGPVIPLNTNLVRQVGVCFPDANGVIIQVSAANPLPTA
jgi:hypothetical protein